MNRALAYGLMGAAQGGLQGLQDEWKQNQEDIRTQKLLQAKTQEAVALKQMEAQFNSAATVQKISAQLQADQTLQTQKAADASSLQTQRDAAAAQRTSATTAAEQARANTTAGATIQAAKIRASATQTPRPSGNQIWQLPDGTNVLVKPGESPPTKGQLLWTNGGSVGARIRGGTPGVGSALNGFGAAPAVNSSGATSSPATASPAPTSYPAIPASAAQYLQQHPDTQALFDQKYGSGAAARILGQ